MSIATTFDTHAFIKRFKAVGFSEQQAEEVATALREVRDARMEDLATRGDLEHTIELAKAELRKDIEASKAEIIKWMFGVAAGQCVFIFTILKMLPLR
ncbi:MAG: CCDC90 family protein [Magnetococcus sp. DMHC-1]|nr:DUF1640 domain-containing protein [Magnetococcales bacterium]